MSRKQATTIGIVSVVSVMVIAFIVMLANNYFSRLLATDELGAKQPPVQLNEQARALNDAFVAVSNAVLTEVVSISVEIEEKSQPNPFQEEFKDFFKFFGEPAPEDHNQSKQRFEGSGSGVIISDDGYIVTNNHVVENAITIKVKTSDKKEYKAKLIGTDPMTDIALIKIDASGLPMAYFAEIKDVKVGEWVVAVGNPLGLTQTVTAGIVSAIGRGGLGLPTNAKNANYNVENFIQTDAAINPGNSGGGLFNLSGGLVGINSAIATRTGGYMGYGFAIPVDLVKSVVLDLKANGKVNRGYIGVQIRSIDEVEAKGVGLSKVEGAMVHGVLKGSPAEKSGVQIGDVILQVNGKPISTSNELQSEIAMHRAGDYVDLTIWRDEKQMNIKVKLEPREEEPTTTAEASKGEEEEETSKALTFDKLGFTVDNLTSDLKSKLGADYGVVVTKVQRYSEAESRGMQVNGVITKVNREKITSVSQLKKIIDGRKSGDVVMLQLHYKDSDRIVGLEIP
jgi:serine protease Do